MTDPINPATGYPIGMRITSPPGADELMVQWYSGDRFFFYDVAPLSAEQFEEVQAVAIAHLRRPEGAPALTYEPAREEPAPDPEPDGEPEPEGDPEPEKVELPGESAPAAAVPETPAVDPAIVPPMPADARRGRAPCWNCTRAKREGDTFRCGLGNWAACDPWHSADGWTNEDQAPPASPA